MRWIKEKDEYGDNNYVLDINREIRIEPITPGPRERYWKWWLVGSRWSRNKFTTLREAKQYAIDSMI